MGKNSKARDAEQRRQYQEARRREELERQRRQDRLMWQIVIGVAAVVVVIAAISVVISMIAKGQTPPAMDDLDFSPVELSDCQETEKVTDLVRMNITYTDKDGAKKTGDVIVRLYEKVAPITVANFQKLVKEDFYNGLTFHRVYSGFMIQGGDPKGDGTGSSTAIKGEMTENGVENNLSHVRGVISMARRGNSYDSGSCQFFIVHNSSAAASLDNKYASFGYVVYGMDTVDGIAGTEVTYQKSSSEKTSPVNPVTINYMTFVEIKK